MEYKFFDRELSWLSFNYRVLQEAKDPAVPLYERIKFLAIYSSNLDEFFRVRVASLRSLLSLKRKTQRKLEFDPEKLLAKIHRKVYKQQEEFGEIYRKQILPELAKNNIFIVDENQLSEEKKIYVKKFFKEKVSHYINKTIISENESPLFIKNKSIYLVVKLISDSGETSKNKSKIPIKYSYGIFEIPTEHLQRFIILPQINNKQFLIFLDDLIRCNLQEIFESYKVIEAHSIKLTRDAELYIDDEFSGSLLEKIKKSINKRKTGVPSRFLYDLKIPKETLRFLKKTLGLSKDDLIPGAKYHNFNDFFSFPNFGQEKLNYQQLPPLPSKELNNSNTILNTIEKKDVLLFFPYQSYEYVIKFIEEAAIDESVKSIKTTLYRTAKHSRIIKALVKAAENSKSVTAFVEIKARFDEELNFQNAEELEKAGIKVFYSFPGLKVHCKICLIKKCTDDKSKYYAFVSTGNFNEKTATIYSDLGLFTSNELITQELKKVFNILTKKSNKENFNTLLVSPFNLRKSFTSLIENEIKNAKEGKKASITLKLNSLEDKKIITKLYDASNAGVKIFINVRGICCLIPGIKGMSKNIKVINIIDRFLEHARIYVFHNNGNEKYFIASADLMKRNLDKRIEICMPIFDKTIRSMLLKIINIQKNDNTKARKINKSQSNPYVKSDSKSKIRSQYQLYEMLKEKNMQQTDNR